LDRHLDTMDFIRDAFRNDLRIEGGLLADDCTALYYGPNETRRPTSRPTSDGAADRRQGYHFELGRIRMDRSSKERRLHDPRRN
jgi:hypothetical protein